MKRISHRLADFRERSRIYIPQLHPYIPQLWASVLRRYGYNAMATGEETLEECTLGRTFCRGSECLPAAVTIGRFLSRVSENDADSSGVKDVLLMPRAEGPCRFGQYATLQSRILERSGNADAMILSPTSEDSYAFLTPAMERNVWRAICLGDMLYKLRCRIMPYHENPQEAGRLINMALEETCSMISEARDWKPLVRSLAGRLASSLAPGHMRKPLVGIVGEIFVRLNSFSNQHIVEFIETSGGEAWLSPLSEWLYYVREILLMKSGFKATILHTLKRGIMHLIEHEVESLFSPLLDDRHEPP
ncbi:hypothetical protein EG829_33825, partial [bacterium]|nr:hypothetical protein [bacterium]